MSDDSKRRRGGMSRYLNGGENALVRRPPRPREKLEQGTWTHEQLLRMDDCFVVAVEAAIRLGLENRTPASAVERPGAGDSAIAS